ncbi:MAG: glycoside hydrolase [Gammaproteobacteria bacterium]|nr:glycoside hydrolase [Gammaproteobacteria bacterium]
MSVDIKLKVVLCWHMHQPDYRGPEQGDYQLPWVYLHATKDYADMISHIEQNPDARAVVNFAPVLLEQLEDYARQIENWLAQGELIRDPLLAALAGPGLPQDAAARGELIRSCQRANEQHLIERFAPFSRLVEIARAVEQHEESLLYLNDQFLADLLVWYHIAWMGEYARSNDLRIESLEKKGTGYNSDDRRALVAAIGDLISGLVDRYGKMAREGRIELSVTPYAHPIVPLLLDLHSAREAMPEITMPDVTSYPGGEPRARWHIRRGIEVFRKHFGFTPKGCWPSEGGVSSETLRLLEEEGFLWAASGQQVLHNSLSAFGGGEPLPENWVHQPYRLEESRLCSFFRDDGLSDLIGFTYADWHADDAVSNLVQHLETIGEATGNQPNRVVSIIMDGENAWEYYPRNGSFFLKALYEKLASHPKLELTTFSECIDYKSDVPSLSELVAGSWVYGTFSTWIGDPDKNRAWEMLVEAKQAYDKVLASAKLSSDEREAATLQLAHCEGSDWFWWFGDYNPGDTVSDFERLFRLQLTYLYQLIKVQPPDYLAHAFAHGSGDPALGGVMRQSN